MLRGLAIFMLVLLTTTPLLARGQTIPVPESIRAENVPPIPSSLSTALNRYQNIRSASFEDWDDSRGRAMYVTTRFADTPQAHHVAVPGAARRQLTFFNERVLNVSARPKHDQFLYAMDEGGAENYPWRSPVGAPGRGCDRPSCRTGPPRLADGRAPTGERLQEFSVLFGFRIRSLLSWAEELGKYGDGGDPTKVLDRPSVLAGICHEADVSSRDRASLHFQEFAR